MYSADKYYENRHVVQMDVEEPNLNNVANDADEQQAYDIPKIPKKDWFKKSPRPKTLEHPFYIIHSLIFQIMPPRKAPRTRTTPATTTNTTSVTNAQLQAMIDQGVTAALAACDANRSTNGEDGHNSGTGVRRTERVARECTYQEFMKCQPLYFKGTEGVVELTQWFERMETVFRISKCSIENQTKFSTCTLLASALTWMFSEESDKIEKYVGGLPDMIHGSVMASRPKTMQDTIKMATELMDKKISTLGERQAENKRKLDNNNQAQQ
ncbi:hypothetical protein Tco_0576961 [Tanacetum coccineum]